MTSSLSWVPTPTFLYRNYLYEKIVSKIKNNKKYLLMGVGTGYFIKKLENLGFKGEAIDISKEAIRITKNIVDNKKTNVHFGNILKYKSARKFDLVFSFEVLEHIKDDQLAINNVYKLLTDNGTFIFSVPAHMSKWGKMDVLGGHFRRYERNEIIKKLRIAGFEIKRIWTFGFPILNAIQFISRTGFFTKNDLNVSKTNKTKKSGIRLDYDPKFRFLLSNHFLLMPLFKLLDLFVTTDRGLGYIVVAKKTPTRK
ncbi:MAG: class I SAM-dependent methyltransferase [Patescibacteria group bacterium]